MEREKEMRDEEQGGREEKGDKWWQDRGETEGRGGGKVGGRITGEFSGAVTSVTVKADRLFTENYQTLFCFTTYTMRSWAHAWPSLRKT